VSLLALVLLAVVVLAAIGMWLTFTLIHMLLTLAIAGLVGGLADMLVPGKMPGGWLGAVAAGLIGGWIGAAIIGNVGPSLFGVSVLPSFVGAALLAAAAEVAGKWTAGRE
jgi:uncharacterized membrane protein YeaQ/YmgE (transglycosylase-associated protein family)